MKLDEEYAQAREWVAHSMLLHQVLTRQYKQSKRNLGDPVSQPPARSLQSGSQGQLARRSRSGHWQLYIIASHLNITRL